MSPKAHLKWPLQFSMSLCSLLNFASLDCGITLGFTETICSCTVVLFNETVKSERGAGLGRKEVWF